MGKSMESALENAFKERPVSYDTGLLKLVDDLISFTDKDMLDWTPEMEYGMCEEICLATNKESVCCSFELYNHKYKKSGSFGITQSLNGGVFDWFKFMLPEEYYSNLKTSIKNYYKRKKEYSKEVFVNLNLNFLKENEDARFF